MLLRQTILYLPAQIVGPLAQVGAALVWTHWLAPAQYGILTFLIASQDLLFLTCLSWWTHYTMRYFGALSDRARIPFLRAEAPIFLWTFVLQVVGLVVVLALLREPVTARELCAAAAYAGSRSLLNHLGERARALSRIGIYTLGQFLGSIVGFAMAYAAIRWVSPTLESVLYGFAFAQALGVAVLWRRLGIVRGGAVPDAGVLRAAFRYGAPLLVAGGLAWLAQNGIRFVTEWTQGADALGLLAVGWGLGMRLSTTLAMLVVAASFPLAVQSLKQGARADAYGHLSRGGTLLCGLIVPASIGLCFLVVPFTTLFVAAPFRAATIAILPCAALTGALRNMRMHIADPVFLLIERPGISTLLGFVDAVLVMAGCTLGAWTGGLTGAVAGCLAATAVSALVGFALASRIADFHLAYADGLRILAASGAMAAVLALVPWAALVPGDIGRLALESATGMMVYAVAIVALFPGHARSLRGKLLERRQGAHWRPRAAP